MTMVWLSDLEEKVRAAAQRLGELRAENARLEARVRELETRLEERASGGEAEAAWGAEREEIRERALRLVEHLEELLGEP